jgi:hypothetical protein
MDWMEQEQERGITITSAATTCLWKDHLDQHHRHARPRRLHRRGRAVAARARRRGRRVRRVAGVEPQSETVWRQADKYGVPRICFINKMDRLGADFYAASTPSSRPPRRHRGAIQLPIGAESDFKGVVDLVEMKAHIWPARTRRAKLDTSRDPRRPRRQGREYRAELIETVAEVDESSSRSTSRTRRSPPTSSAPHPRRHHRQPLRAGAQRVRVQEQGRAAAARRGRRLPAEPARPAPGQRHERQGDEELERKPTDDEPFSALAFKIMTDPHVGKLTYFRVYSGTLAKGDTVLNVRTGKKERLGRLLQMHANHREDSTSVFTGDIVAGIGLKNTTTGDTLCDPDHPIVLESMSSRARSSTWPSSPRPRPTRTSWARPPARSPRRTPPSWCAPTRRPARPSSPAWASCTSRCSSTACCASSRSTPTSASPRSPTARPSPRRSRRSPTPTRSRPAARASSPRSDHPRAHRPRWRLRVRRQDHRWPHPQGVHPLGRRRHPAALDRRRARRVPHRRRAGHPHRRQVPRRRLLGDGVQDRRLDGVQGGGPQGQARAARAGHEGRGRHPRGLHGRRHRRPQLPPRPDRRHGASAATPGHRREVPLSEMFGYVTDLRSRPRVGPATRCSSTPTSSAPNVQEEIVKRDRGEGPPPSPLPKYEKSKGGRHHG